MPSKKKKKQKKLEEEIETIHLPTVEEEDEDSSDDNEEEIDLEKLLEEEPPLDEEEQQQEEDDSAPLVDAKTEQIKIKQIQEYYRILPWLNEELPFDEQGELTYDEWLTQINLLVNNRTSFELIKLGFFTVAGGIETLSWELAQIDIKGYERALRANPEIEDILRILKVKHMNSLSEVEPEYKLLGLMFCTALSIYRLKISTQTSSSTDKLENYSVPYKE